MNTGGLPKRNRGEKDDAAKGSRFKKRYIVYLVVLAILAAVGYGSCLIYVKPNQFGIKRVLIGFNPGIQRKVYQPGYRFVLPYIEELFLFPRDLQVLEMTNHPTTSAMGVRYEKAALIQTSDGFFVEVDVSILYRIVDPYLVFTTLGPGNLYEENGIIPKAEPILKQTLGELTTEQFYNSPLRVKHTRQAKRLLNQELEPKGLRVEQVLIRYFQYSPEIQKNIEERKLKDQLVFKNQAEARAAAEEAKLKKVIQEGKAAVRVKLEEGKAYAIRRRAQQELYARKKAAEGDLLIALAEAKKTALKNQALTAAGADRLVALRMAEVYRGLEVVILPSDGLQGINPLNLDQSLRLFELRGGGKEEGR